MNAICFLVSSHTLLPWRLRAIGSHGRSSRARHAKRSLRPVEDGASRLGESRLPTLEHDQTHLLEAREQRREQLAERLGVPRVELVVGRGLRDRIERGEQLFARHGTRELAGRRFARDAEERRVVEVAHDVDDRIVVRQVQPAQRRMRHRVEHAPAAHLEVGETRRRGDQPARGLIRERDIARVAADRDLETRQHGARLRRELLHRGANFRRRATRRERTDVRARRTLEEPSRSRRRSACRHRGARGSRSAPTRGRAAPALLRATSPSPRTDATATRSTRDPARGRVR